jgi:hypothetical protein
VSFERGLTAIYLGPLHCSWLGIQQIFSFINGAPFTVSVFLLGTIVYFVLAWIADRIPPRWEQKETSSKQTGT